MVFGWTVFCLIFPLGIRMNAHPKLTALHSLLDGVSERGGTSPASYALGSEGVAEKAEVMNGSYALGRSLTGVATLEGVHRSKRREPGLTGSVGLEGAGVGEELFSS